MAYIFRKVYGYMVIMVYPIIQLPVQKLKEKRETNI